MCKRKNLLARESVKKSDIYIFFYNFVCYQCGLGKDPITDAEAEDMGDCKKG